MGRFLADVARADATWVLFDFPQGAETSAGLALLSKSYEYTTFKILTSWYGDRTARSRTCVLGARWPKGLGALVLPYMQALKGYQKAYPEGIRSCLTPIDAVEENDWVKVAYKPMSRRSAEDDNFLPASTATYRDVSGTKRLIYCTERPMPTMRSQPKDDLGHGGILILDHRRFTKGSAFHVRSALSKFGECKGNQLRNGGDS